MIKTKKGLYLSDFSTLIIFFIVLVVFFFLSLTSCNFEDTATNTISTDNITEWGLTAQIHLENALNKEITEEHLRVRSLGLTEQNLGQTTIEVIQKTYFSSDEDFDDFNCKSQKLIYFNFPVKGMNVEDIDCDRLNSDFTTYHLRVSAGEHYSFLLDVIISDISTYKSINPSSAYNFGGATNLAIQSISLNEKLRADILLVYTT